METEPITSNGAKKLQDELSDLINNKRQKVIQAIAEAREHGFKGKRRVPCGKRGARTH